MGNATACIAVNVGSIPTFSSTNQRGAGVQAGKDRSIAPIAIRADATVPLMR